METQIYRYPPDAVDRIVAQTKKRKMVLLSLALTAPLIILATSNDGFRSPVTWGIVGLCAFIFWRTMGADPKLRKSVETTQFEFNGDEITGRSPTGAITISRSDVTQLQYRPDGLLIRGRNLTQALQIKHELERCVELTQMIEAWAPSAVKRVSPKRPISFWTVGFVVASIGLFVGAFAVDNPWIGAPACVAAIAVLVVSAVFVWRSPVYPKKLKRSMIVVLFPIFGLAAKLLALWNGG
jgi:hypothetical protein